ncbi:hypothetical protein PAPYR_984 [Paratrimastix pyriformis]|uniref:Uncharacterized protein n=1 Tax=Paratrimastix pyriformis TaxID=342808 RepID=A0ABQ8UX71_9EUKA|nr:hypothetical protein PAPYR_984 [Paratrimastix pyriformis]
MSYTVRDFVLPGRTSHPRHHPPIPNNMKAEELEHETTIEEYLSDDARMDMLQELAAQAKARANDEKARADRAEARANDEKARADRAEAREKAQAARVKVQADQTAEAPNWWARWKPTVAQVAAGALGFAQPFVEAMLPNSPQFPPIMNSAILGVSALFLTTPRKEKAAERKRFAINVGIAGVGFLLACLSTGATPESKNWFALSGVGLQIVCHGGMEWYTRKCRRQAIYAVHPS